VELRENSRLPVWIGVGIASIFVLVLIVLLFFTQTRTGRGVVLDYTVGALQGTLDGRIEVERLRGNLIRGATLEGVRITGPEEGEHFLEADSARIAYSLRSFILGRVVLREVVLHRPVVDLVRKPDQELWNFQIIFGEPDPDVAPRATYIDFVEIHDGEIRMVVPWDPDPDLSPAARDAEIRNALDPDSRIVVEEIPEGLVRIMRFSGVNGVARDIQLAADELGGSYFAIERLAADIHVWREPARVRHLRGELAMFGDGLEFDAPEIRLPDSWIQGYGNIQFGDDGGIDVTLSSDSVALADLQWLYPDLPDEGGGALILHIETRPEGVLYFAREADVSLPGTRIVGQFGVLLNGSLQFVEPDLVADPLRISAIEDLLPAGLPVTDLRIRRAEVVTIGN